jgi:hypothetical protein
MQVYHKAVSLDHCYTYYSPPTSQLHQQLSQIAVLAIASNPAITSSKLQYNLLAI